MPSSHGLFRCRLSSKSASHLSRRGRFVIPSHLVISRCTGLGGGEVACRFWSCIGKRWNFQTPGQPERWNLQWGCARWWWCSWRNGPLPSTYEIPNFALHNEVDSQLIVGAAAQVEHLLQCYNVELTRFGPPERWDLLKNNQRNCEMVTVRNKPEN